MARIQWQRFAWKSGADDYVFEVIDGGMFGRLAVGTGRDVTLPMIAWEGMLDCVAMARKARVQSDRMQPDRAFARWSDEEVARLQAGFSRGRGITELAKAHNRSQDAVEHQLVKLGLWNRFERRPMSEAPPFAAISGNGPRTRDPCPWEGETGSEDPSGGLRQDAP